MTAEYDKAILLECIRCSVLTNAQNEFRYMIEKLDGNEKIAITATYLFKEGFDRLKDNKRIEKDVVGVLSGAFSDSIDEFKEYIKLNKVLDNDINNSTRANINQNLSIQMGQVVRYINFIYCLKYFEKIGDSRPFLLKHAKEIKEYIFKNKPTWEPSIKVRTNNGQRVSGELWAYSYKNLINDGNKKKIGFEPYYISGSIELIRKMSNKMRHGDGFHKNFLTEFDFHDDFIQLMSVYNTSLYAFLELLEAWIAIKPFIEAHRDIL